MKKLKALSLLLVVVVFLSIPHQANATGWEITAQHSWIDSDGCAVIETTEEYHLFGITWSTRTTYDKVCAQSVEPQG